MEVVDVAAIKAALAKRKVEPVLAPEACAVPKLEDVLLALLPPLAPLTQSDGVVRPNVRDAMHAEASPPCSLHHGPHAGQVASREDVLADEVTAAAVRLVPLIRAANGLDDSPAAWLQHVADGGEVGLEVLVADCLDHLNAHHLVVGASAWAVPVVAEQQRDLLLQACCLDAGRGLCQLLLGQGQPSHPAAGGLSRPDGKAPPATPDLQHMVALLDLGLLDDRVNLVELGLVQGLALVMNSGAVRHGLIQEQRVHGVASIVVLLNVLAAALNGVGSCEVCHIQQPVPQPVEQTQGTAIGLSGLSIGHNHSNQGTQVISLKVPVHIGLAQAGVMARDDLAEKVKREHTQGSTEAGAAAPLLTLRHWCSRAVWVSVSELISVGQDDAQVAGGECGRRVLVKQVHVE
mmetsp:Transcript_37421/g.83265  ORF Transcript_37421/g.83265 Transcript_37421/m.83265 type:complete len:404 (-) Transcript_37421:1461-2672(-)